MENEKELIPKFNKNYIKKTEEVLNNINLDF
jgi:hypothetical protein